VINEVYRDFVLRGAPPAGHTLGPRGVSIGSLTKVYGLGEARVGWAVGDAELMHRASRVNDFGVVNGPYVAERIGAIALARRARLLARTKEILGRNRPLLERFLRATPALDAVRPAGGTVIFPRLRGIADSRGFAERALAEQRVCVVPGDFFGAPGHIRIGIGGRDPRRLAEGLRRLGAAIRATAGAAASTGA
jgi:aspartate/methionine/tyrosine aminotransferase